MTTKQSHTTWLVILAVGVIVVMTSIVLIVMVREHIIDIAKQSDDTSNSQSKEADSQTYATNNEVQAQAIEQKNPTLCEQITGPTSVSFPLPTANNGVQNTTRIFDQAESITRCQTQAKAGTNFVY